MAEAGDAGLDLVLMTGGQVAADCRTNSAEADRISGYIDRLLQMDHLTLLVGAGASYHLGGPRIRNLTIEDLRKGFEEFRLNLSEEESGLLASIWPSERSDLEQVLGVLTRAIGFLAEPGGLQLTIQGSDLPAARLRVLRTKLNQWLAKQCDLPRMKLDDPWEAHQKFFTRLLRSRRSDLSIPHVFTTNYDLAIESALDEAGIGYADGFIGGVRRRFHPETLDTHEGPASPGGGGVALVLYKIHGSINWRAVTSSDQDASAAIEQASQIDVGGDQLSLIFPTPLKETDMLGYPYADMYRRFATRLNMPETALLILGYGFSDEHLNRVIAEAMSANPTLQLFVVQPHRVLRDAKPAAGDQSRASRLAYTSDNRIGVLTGAAAEFARMADSAMPDPDRLAHRGTPLYIEEVHRALVGHPTVGPAKA